MMGRVPALSRRRPILLRPFAAALLMPAEVMARFGSWASLGADVLVDRLNTVASALRVTSSALRWRLVALGELPATRARKIPESSLCNNGGQAVELDAPPSFSKPFAEVLGMAIEQGRVSTRRAAALINVSVDELPGMLAAHGVEHKVEQ